MNLYQLKEDYLQALNTMTVDEETGEVIGADLLDEIQDQIKDKLLNYGKAVKMLNDEALLIGLELERLESLRNKAIKKREWLKQVITDHLTHDQKLEDLNVCLSYRKSEAVEIVAMDQLPPELVKTKVLENPDKIAIRNYLKAGNVLAGAKLVEHYNLIIK